VHAVVWHEASRSESALASRRWREMIVPRADLIVRRTGFAATVEQVRNSSNFRNAMLELLLIHSAVI
jgi:hypothetical protein